MVRLFYIVGISSLLASCGVFALCARQWYQADPQHETLLRAAGAVQRYAENVGERAQEDAEQVSPLVAQAEIFASCLNPPRPGEERILETPPVVETKWEPPVPMPPVRPTAPLAKFTLLATSFCPSQPGRSMALISEVGSLEGNERWVKEGAQVGHFVIHEEIMGTDTYFDLPLSHSLQRSPGFHAHPTHFNLTALAQPTRGSNLLFWGGFSRRPARQARKKALHGISGKATEGTGMGDKARARRVRITHHCPLATRIGA